MHAPEARDLKRVAGVDEAGRGPLAGPVVAAAVILDPRRRIRGLADSKVLSAAERARLAPIIMSRALAWGVGRADRDEIDTLNILEATLLAMRRALLALPVPPTHVRVDGNRCPHCGDQRRLDPRQDVPRRADGGARCALPRLRAGDAQGLRHGGASRGAQGARPFRAASALLQSHAGYR
jgi:hypothetical protein